MQSHRVKKWGPGTLTICVLLTCLPLAAQQGTPVSAAAAKPAAKTAAHKAAGCTVMPVNYRGWKATELANPWVKLYVVPEVGGRLMQVNFGGHDLLYIDPKFAGQVLPLGEQRGGDHNYGGDKINPLPEGGQDEQHWAGFGGYMDYAPNTLKVLAREPNHCAVRLPGPRRTRLGSATSAILRLMARHRSSISIT